MKTNLQGKFLSSDHKARFNQLVSINKTYANDINYTSAGYLLSANEEIFYKVLPYMKTGIDFRTLKQKVDFSFGQFAIVRFAFDLYSGGSPLIKDLSLTDLSGCDTDMVVAVIQAALIYLEFDDRADGYLLTKTMMAQLELGENNAR